MISLSKKDFRLLKSNLKNIDKIKNKEPVLKQKIESYRDEIKNENKRMKEIKKSIAELDAKRENHKKWVSEKLDEQKELEDEKSELKTQLDDFDDVQGKEIDERYSKISELKKIHPGEVSRPSALVLLFFLVLIGVLMGDLEAAKLPRGEWTCNNGEIIDLLDVDNDIKDCSDGSDEDSGWFSGRAAEVSSSPEAQELRNAKVLMFFKMVMIVSSPAIVITTAVFITSAKKRSDLSSEISKMESENQTQRFIRTEIGKKFTYTKDSLSKVDLAISGRGEELEQIPKLESILILCKQNVEKMREKIDATQDEIRENQREEKRLWNEIKHLIPSI